MCGIVGYVGARNATDVILDGLHRLEYRGYDSAGIAIRTNGKIKVLKEIGKVADLECRVKEEENFNGTIGIGHTRWATHGGVTVVNAHPHLDQSSNVVLVHNGIIENYQDLRRKLEAKGFHFRSETDTEVVAQLLACLYDEDDPVGSLRRLSEKLRGSFALAILFQHQDHKIFCIRKGSPLVLGLGDGEYLCASDVPAVLPYTREVVYLDEGEICELSLQGVKIWGANGESVYKKSSTIAWDLTMVDKNGYPHFMLKEINEQGAVLRRTIKDRLLDSRVDLSEELPWNSKMAKKWRKVHIVACGTSYYAALVAEKMLERCTDLDIRVDIASEYRYRKINADEDTLAVFVSQSGETADTLAAERYARSKGARCLAVTNVMGSSLAREVDDVLLLKAGPEIGVAATKTFTGQLAVLTLMSLYLGDLRENLSKEEEERLVSAFSQIPYKVESILERHQLVRDMAAKYSLADDFLFLGRGFSFPIALEGALKLKEISYVHAEAYAAGEMKHGPIALLDENVPVVVIMPSDSLYEKSLSNVQEARARRSPIIAIGTDGNDALKENAEDVISVPPTEEELQPFLTAIPLQLFAYYVADRRNCEIDQPRNLAKSVTVE